MKCSLLTLSTYIDGELPQDRRSEVDAHLVGCPRCSTGAATLREEKTRVAQLARVRMSPHSAETLLEQVGITGAAVSPSLAHRASAPAVEHPPEQLPWRAAAPAGGGGAALPWTPQRPQPASPTREEMQAPAVSPDVQPSLPFDNLLHDGPLEVEAHSPHPSPAADLPGGDWSDDDIGWGDADSPPDPGWEADLPPAAMYPPQPVPAEPPDDRPEVTREQPGFGPGAPSHRQPVDGAPSLPLSAPVRAQSSPAGAVWSRVRDAVAVRMALARGPGAVDDSVQISSGPPPSRGMPLPAAPVAEPEVDDDAVELMGNGAPMAAPVPAHAEPAHVAPERPEAIPRTGELPERPSTPSWNAFGGAAYGAGAVEEDHVAGSARTPAAPPRPLGRHTRAVIRDRPDLGTRVRAALAAIAATLGRGSAAAASRTRHARTAAASANRDRRLLAIGGVVTGIVLVVFLLLRVTAAKPTTAIHSGPPATVAPSAAVSAAAQSAVPTAAPTAPAANAAALPNSQTFGAGATGLQVTAIRYGQHTGYLRVVFDLGPASGSASGGSPRVVVSFTDAQTMLVTFAGVVPAGSTGTPPAGGVVSSVSLGSSGGGTTVYKVKLAHPVSVTAGYSTAVHFVVDLH